MVTLKEGFQRALHSEPTVQTHPMDTSATALLPIGFEGGLFIKLFPRVIVTTELLCYLFNLIFDPSYRFKGRGGGVQLEI